MARAPDVRADKALELYRQGLKLVEIASQLSVPEGTVRSWKNRYDWDNATLQKDKRNVAKAKGGQPGNKNAAGNEGGAPSGNKNSERYGFFAKWLPSETMEIMQSIQRADPLDLLWDNIQLQYTAIIRAQHIMFVKDQTDITTTKIGEVFSDTGSSEKWEVQQAWDKHATFLKAQSRAMGELRSMIKQYDELLHKNWELATEEQKARIEVMKAKANLSDNEPTEDDGFLDALSGKVDEIWSEE